MIKQMTLMAAASAVALLLGASGAMAVEAQAKSAVNVRTGPGTTYGKVDQLDPGEVVEITECAPSNFCFITHDGPDGWVSSSYLTAVEADEEDISEGGGSNPDCSFGFEMTPQGPKMSINCGDGPVPPGPPPSPPPVDDEDDEDVAQACFYTGADFGGDKFCMDEGTRNALNGTFNDKITSVELSGGLKARLCENTGLGGYCRNITVTTETLVSQINNKASSLVVYSGAPPVTPDIPLIPLPLPVTPSTYLTGPIELKQTWSADFDTGTSGSGGEDVWYEAVTNTEKYLKPVNGGKMALGDGSNRGFAGCNTESYSTAKIALDDAPVGTYICVKTNQGRVSQFRVNGFAGTTMKIGFTTWAN